MPREDIKGGQLAEGQDRCRGSSDAADIKAETGLLLKVGLTVEPALANQSSYRMRRGCHRRRDGTTLNLPLRSLAM